MVVKRVGPLSFAKIAGVTYAILGLIFGGLISLVAMAGLFALPQADTGTFGAFGALFGIGAVVMLPIFYGVMGFVTTLIGAALYNVVAGLVGGIEIDIG